MWRLVFWYEVIVPSLPLPPGKGVGIIRVHTGQVTTREKPCMFAGPSGRLSCLGSVFIAEWLWGFVLPKMQCRPRSSSQAYVFIFSTLEHSQISPSGEISRTLLHLLPNCDFVQLINCADPPWFLIAFRIKPKFLHVMYEAFMAFPWLGVPQHLHTSPRCGPLGSASPWGACCSSTLCHAAATPFPL